MSKCRRVLLELAHIIDAWRVIPRAMVAMYGLMIYKLFLWYTNIETFEETTCDNPLIQTLLEQNIDIEKATEIACTIVDTVGGPTSQQTSFVTIVIGLSSAIFGLYVNSGGDWRNKNYNMYDHEPTGKKDSSKIPWRKANKNDDQPPD